MPNKRLSKILLLDTDPDFTHVLADALAVFPYELKISNDGIEFFTLIQIYNPDVIVLNLQVSGNDFEGVELFRILTYEISLKAKVIIYSKYEKAFWISAAYKIGNYNLYQNATRFSLNELIKQINSAVNLSKQEEQSLTVQVNDYIQKQKIVYSHPFIGESESIRNSRQQIARLAKAEEDMFVIGETGTGKEVAAYYFYLNSKRFGKPINMVNCSALTETLIESELYGHIKGSFTSAEKTKIGLFELCDKGVLFLDEITNMTLSAQSKLLRSIENKEIQVVGGEAKKVDTRLIFASNASLDILSRSDVIRKDLFYRIESNIVELVPLRERKEDITLLTNHFLARFSTIGYNIDFNSAEESKDLLLSYPWPGNVRELKNFCKNLLINEREITPHVIKKSMEAKISKFYKAEHDPNIDFSNQPSLKLSLAEYEKQYLLYNLNINSWRISETARKIGVERTTLYKKIRLYKLHQPKYV